MSHAFSKVLLQILDMFLLNRALFQVKNLLWGLMEILFTESLVLDHNFQESDMCLFYPRLHMFYPISEGKTNAWFSPLIFLKGGLLHYYVYGYR